MVTHTSSSVTFLAVLEAAFFTAFFVIFFAAVFAVGMTISPALNVAEFGGLVKRRGENQALEQGFRNFHRKGAEGKSCGNPKIAYT
jgi:hypothetical protein